MMRWKILYLFRVLIVFCGLSSVAMCPFAAFAQVPPDDAAYITYNEGIDGQVNGIGTSPGNPVNATISVVGSDPAWWMPESITHDGIYHGGQLQFDPLSNSWFDSTWDIETRGTAQADGGETMRVAAGGSLSYRGATGLSGNGTLIMGADAWVTFDTIFLGAGTAPTSVVPVEIVYRLGNSLLGGSSNLSAWGNADVSVLADGATIPLDKVSIQTLIDVGVSDPLSGATGSLTFDAVVGNGYRAGISANTQFTGNGGLSVTLDNLSGWENIFGQAFAEMSLRIAPDFAYLTDYELRIPPSALVQNPDFAVVPVSAAIWFFGSALGLLGLMRRKTA